jgi:hypothetical protein
VRREEDLLQKSRGRGVNGMGWNHNKSDVDGGSAVFGKEIYLHTSS